MIAIFLTNDPVINNFYFSYIDWQYTSGDFKYTDH